MKDEKIGQNPYFGINLGTGSTVGAIDPNKSE
jgi:hypothetical protein